MAKRPTRLGHRLSLAAALIMLGVAAWLMHRYLLQIRWRDFAAAWARLPASHIAGSLLAAGVSFAMLALFEMQAARLTVPGRLSMRRAAFGGAVANALANTLGFHAITASAVRYRVYGAAGLGAGDTARIVGVAGLGVGLGFAVVITGALCWEPAITHGWGRWPGLALLAALAVLLAWLGRRPRSLRLFGWTLVFPDARNAALQMLIGAVEMTAAIAALYILLPPSIAPPFVDFLPIYVGAVLAGLISHAPGGLGVFESIVLASFTQAQRPDLLAAMLCYRLTYSLLPFVLGSLALAAHEAHRRVTRRGPSPAAAQLDGG
jgi:uncharacterized membrane protein YbhN (UPF0104 family)